MASGTFNGREATFSLTESDLHVESQETLSYDLDSIVAVTENDEGRSFDIHLFTSKNKDWSPKDLVYEKHTARGLPTALIEQLSIPRSSRSLSLSGPDRDLLICISGKSGTGAATVFFENALHPLLENLGIVDYEKLETSSAESILQLSKDIIVPRANKGREQTVILLSGDGGPVDMINALAEGLDTTHAKIPTLALLPLGTGNALSHSSGLTKDKTVGVRSILLGSPKPIPTFEVTLSPGSKFVTEEGQSREDIPNILSTDGSPALYGAVVCSWGFHASLVADSDTVEYRKFGAERFKMAGKELLYPSDGSAPHAYKGKLTVLPEGQGSKWKEVGGLEHAYTLLTLASNLEQSFTISPASKPLDRQLRLIHFGPVPPADIMRLMTLAYQGGKHVEDPAVDYEVVDAMRIDFEEQEEQWRRICVDGKIIAVEEGGWVQVKPGRTVLNLLAP